MGYPVGKFRTSRRTFLKGVTVAGGTAALACVADTTLAESESNDKPVNKENSKGYQDTPHIREYYEKARF